VVRYNKNVINLSVLICEWLLIIITIHLNQKISSLEFHLVSIIFIGTRIHALGILMHEASHFNLLTNPKLNDLVTKLFITGPVFISLDSYRQSHQLHHQYSLTEKDPTHTRKMGEDTFSFPKKNHTHLFFEILKISLGYGLYLTLKDLTRNHTYKKLSKPTSSKVIWLAPLLYISIIIYTQNFMNYLCYWLIPILTVLPLLNYWRTITEHSNVSTPEPTRTVIYHPLLQWLITPYNINHHLEHHLFPKKSWYNLNQLSAHEKEKLKSGKITYGFINLWNEFIR
jgi:fatty acid desaturase